MKTKLKESILLLFSLCAFFTPASGSVVILEGFDYENGTLLNGQTGGFGWTGAWVVNANTIVQKVENGVFYGQDKAQSAALPNRAVNFTKTSGTYYVSVDLFNVNNTTGTYFLNLRNGSETVMQIGQARETSVWCLRFKLPDDASDHNRYTTYSSRTDEYSEPSRLVLAMDVTNQAIRFYVDPDLEKRENQNTPALYFADQTNFEKYTTITGIVMNTWTQFNDTNNYERTWDNIAIATDWNDLKSIPEPSSVALAIGAVALGAWGMRRRGGRKL